MNELPEGYEQPRIPLTVMYVNAGETPGMGNLKAAYLQAYDFEDAKKMINILHPGVHVVGVSNGHRNPLEEES